MFHKLTTYAALFFLAAFLLTSFGLWMLVRDRDALQAEKGRLETALTAQKAATDAAVQSVNDWKKSAEQFQQTLDTAVKTQAQATEEKRRLENVLSKHDLEELAKKKPGLVEKRVNSGTASMLRMLEGATAGHGAAGPTEAGGDPASASPSAGGSR